MDGAAPVRHGGAPDLVSCLHEAVRRRERWDLVGARRMLAQAVAAGPKKPSVDRLATATARRLLAEVLRELGEPGPAYRMVAPLVGECERDLGPGHPATIRALAVLAGVLHDLGELDRAEALYRQVLDGPTGPTGRTVVLTRARLALLHRDRGELAVARTQLAAAYVAHRRAYGPDDVDTLRLGVDLAGLHRAAADLAAARRVLAATYAGCRARLGEDHALTAAVERSLAEIGPPTRPAPQPSGRVRRWKVHRPKPVSRARRRAAPPGRRGATKRTTRHRGPVRAPAHPPTRDPGEERPRRRPGRLRVWAAVALAAMALGGVGMGLAAAARPGPAPVAGPAPSRSAVAPDGPTTPELRLRDDGASVTVSWPGSASGAVVIALTADNGPPAVVAHLPPGSHEYTVTGLDIHRQYCVIVGTVADATAVTRAARACTSRGSAPSPRLTAVRSP